jgi:Ca2+-transporting ATPase
MQTTAVLSAFVLGLLWVVQESGVTLPPGANPLTFLLRYNWRGLDVQTAETMAFVTLSLCELFRANTVRSEFASLFRIGPFSNRYMVLAVGVSIALLLLVCAVPPLQVVFNTHFMSLREWSVVLGLSLLPAISEEITKFVLRGRLEREQAKP